MRSCKLTALAILTASSLALGCSSDPSAPPTPSIGTREAFLSQAQSCQDLEAKLKADQLLKMNAQIDSLRNAPSYAFPNAAEDGSSGAGGPVGADVGPNAPERSHSDTNTQVKGVDEADIVKTDGDRLYVLHGQKLAIVNAYPAEELALAGGVSIEGYPSEMFLADDKIVVFSSVDAGPIFQATDLPTIDGGCGYAADCGYYPSLTKVTILGLNAERTSASVLSEHWFEGHYSSSRRVDHHVRAVLTGGQRGPALEYWPSYYSGDWSADSFQWRMELEVMRARNRSKIEESTLADYLPRRFVRQGGAIEQVQVDCTSYLVPTEGSTEWGMTEVHAFDLDAPSSAPQSLSIAGYASTIYASAESLYVAAQGWRDPFVSSLAPGANPVSTSYTHVHKFDLSADPAQPKYVASGTVDGTVHNQFSLDEHKGTLRIATTDWLASSTQSQTRNHVFLLNEVGGALEVAGAVQDLAPGETIQSARFLGDRGYVVTFRQVDPLFVLDLADATQPKVLAELKIPGFSSYMHPLGEGTHLLTVGQDATDQGQITGLAVQIFDVSDPAAPALTHKHVIPDATSEVGWDHKAFTFFDGMLAIPSWGWGPSQSWSSRLELFTIDTEQGIHKKGSVDHSPFFAGVSQEGYCYGAGFDVRRSVFIEEALYSISSGGIVASDSSTLATLASLKLEVSTADPYCYYAD